MYISGMTRIFKPVADVRNEKRKARFWTRAKLIFAFAILAVLFYVLVSLSGHFLVRDDSFGHVSWVVILDGQSGDLERSDMAASLVREGRADSLLVLGRRVFRDKNNADFYAEDLETNCGVDAGRIYVYRHDDPSTLEEAVSTLPWLKRRAANDTVLLLTSAPATRRAAFIFNKLSGGHPTFVTLDMHNWRYNADSWIFERESRKNWLREWAAILNAKWELWGADTLETAGRVRREPSPWKPSSREKVERVSVKPEKLVSIREAIASQDSAVEKVRSEQNARSEQNSESPQVSGESR